MLILLSALVYGADCTYQPSVWHTATSRSVRSAPVVVARSALSPEERGPLGCTPCEQDQETRHLSNGLTFRACRQVADRLVDALEQALSEGAVIRTISVYRPIRSRGPLDASGHRTVLSDHAFGVAVDINQAHNGLYGDCVTFGPTCQLLRGGPWEPDRDVESLTADHPVVRALVSAGWQWGGELPGRQKDYMHFTLGE